MKDEIKMLIMSDIHLGLEKPGLPLPQTARVSTLRRICALAAEHDILLIAGDLIDSPELDADLVQIISHEFDRLREKGIEIIYTAGKGEINKNGMASPVIYSFNATYVFSSLESLPYVFMKDGQKIIIYGLPAHAGTFPLKIKKNEESGFHVGLFYVDLDLQEETPDPMVRQLTKNDIKTMELDFYAMGYNHNFRLYKLLDKIVGAYPGSPESTSYKEMNDRYVVSLTISDNQIAEIRRLSVNTMRVCHTEILCSDINSPSVIRERIENGSSQKNIQRYELKGIRKFRLDPDIFHAYEDEYYFLQIIDHTVPSLELLCEDNTQENSIKGEFYSRLAKKFESPETKEKIELVDLISTLHRFNVSGFSSLEEWLCDL